MIMNGINVLKRKYRVSVLLIVLVFCSSCVPIASNNKSYHGLDVLENNAIAPRYTQMKGVTIMEGERVCHQALEKNLPSCKMEGKATWSLKTTITGDLSLIINLAGQFLQINEFDQETIEASGGKMPVVSCKFILRENGEICSSEVLEDNPSARDDFLRRGAEASYTAEDKQILKNTLTTTANWFLLGFRQKKLTAGTVIDEINVPLGKAWGNKVLKIPFIFEGVGYYHDKRVIIVNYNNRINYGEYCYHIKGYRLCDAERGYCIVGKEEKEVTDQYTTLLRESSTMQTTLLSTNDN